MTDSFNAKLMRALQSMSNPIKDTSGHHYKYAQLDQVMDVIKPALEASGLSVRQGIKWFGDKYDLETIVFDESGEHVLDQRPVKIMDDPQKQGSYETYMRRYALLTVFGLAPEDDDGQAAKPSQKPREATRGPQAKQQHQTPEEAAKQRLWAAIKGYCQRNGTDPNAELEELGGKEVMAAKDANWLNARAEFYEAN